MKETTTLCRSNCYRVLGTTLSQNFAPDHPHAKMSNTIKALMLCSTIWSSKIKSRQETDSDQKRVQIVENIGCSL